MKVRHIKLSNKISIKLSLYLIISFIFIAAVAAFLIDSELDRELSQKAGSLVKYEAEALAKPMWDLDEIQINKILRNLSAEDFIVKSIIRDKDGNIIQQSSDHAGKNMQGRAAFIDRSGIFIYSSDIYYSYRGRPGKLGTLVIYTNEDSIRQFMIGLMSRIIFIGLILLAVMVRLLNKTLDNSIEPIKKLATQLKNFDGYSSATIQYSVSDVIEVKELQDALQRMKSHYDLYNEELEETVAQRTGELQNYKNHLEDIVEEQTKDILIAKVAAENANNAKTEFLSNMSHELRTPMHAIISYSQMGLEKLPSGEREKLQKYFDNINRSGRRLLGLLNDLLDLAKMEAGSLHLEKEMVNIKELSDNMINELGSLFRARDLTVKQEFHTADTGCFADRARISQVISNLLSNAIKFSAHGSVITICYRDDISGLEVSVADHGIGIPDTELEKIFDKFIQSSMTKTGSGGTGLGLSICREIINAHNGRIWAENIKEGGARFAFVIPRGDNGPMIKGEG
jgi:signal transduction histidine kinase